MEELLWKELLQTLSRENLSKLLVAVIGNTKEQKKMCNNEKIQSVIKFTLTSRELLTRTALSKRILYNFASNYLKLHVSLAQTKKQIVEEIIRIWSMRATVPFSRITPIENSECRKILMLLNPSAITDIWIKLKPCYGMNSHSDIINDILNSLPSVEWLLNKRCITKEVLEEYLHKTGNALDHQAHKSDLIRNVLHFMRQI